jgi:lysozyme|tara:strand:+ start:17 stop:433 length:417 start_codon:yes stop_codon:yes gene_type:complete
MDYMRLIAQLRKHEGVEHKPYTDTVGKLTIGVGRNLDDRGLSDHEIDFLLQNDIQLVEEELDQWWPHWRSLNQTRQLVVADMMFNMGRPRLSQFKMFLAALQAANYEMASTEMLDSKWASQVKGRATTLADMMSTGDG